MADKYNKPRRTHPQSSGNRSGRLKTKRYNSGNGLSASIIGNGIKSTINKKNEQLSETHQRVRLIFQVLLSIALIFTVIYMLFVDNNKHHHIPYDSQSQIKSQESENNNNNNNNLITTEEIGTTLNHINTARIRNEIPIEKIKPLIEGTNHDIHIVFSSGCTEYQNWQSEVLLYSWARLNHPGQITRLVSGCKDSSSRILASKTAIISERVHLYYAPDFTPPNQNGHLPFHYFNKPYSMQLWLQDKNINILENYIILIDPDMILTRIFNLKNLQLKYGLYEKKPISQKYGIGPKWINWDVCENKINTDCEKNKLSESDAWNYYSVGPPYILHINDWRLMINKWVEYSPKALIKDPPPSILAEMYSFAMASALYNLRYKTIGTMLSDSMVLSSLSEEPWDNINWDFNNLNSANNPKLPNYHFDDNQPHILHYCHGYWLGDDRPSGHVTNFGFNFHKGHLPKDILHNCDIPLLIEPPTDELAKLRDQNKNNHNVWMLYQIITRINSALANYKHLYCPNWVPQFKTILVQPEYDSKHRMHYFIDTL